MVETLCIQTVHLFRAGNLLHCTSTTEIDERLRIRPFGPSFYTRTLRPTASTFDFIVIGV
jgi:hypothetical protein